MIWREQAVHAQASQVELASAWTGQYLLTLLCLAIVAGCKEKLTIWLSLLQLQVCAKSVVLTVLCVLAAPTSTQILRRVPCLTH